MYVVLAFPDNVGLTVWPALTVTVLLITAPFVGFSSMMYLVTWVFALDPFGTSRRSFTVRVESAISVLAEIAEEGSREILTGVPDNDDELDDEPDEEVDGVGLTTGAVVAGGAMVSTVGAAGGVATTGVTTGVLETGV